LVRGVILDRGTLGKDASLDPLWELMEWDIHESTEPGEILDRIKGLPVVLTNKVEISAATMAACPELKFIGVLATGTNNIDLKAAKAQGIQVQNIEDYCSESVAQYWLSVLLALAGSLIPYHQDVAKGLWTESDFFCRLDYPIIPLRRAKLLLIGYGSLGRAVATIAKSAFDMEILLAARLDEKQKENRVQLDDALPLADIISLHCPLTKVTEKIINKKRIALMKPGALLINTARGGLVDEKALIEALYSGHLGGAALDVLLEEPPPLGHHMIGKNVPNLIITPHIAWASQEARQSLIHKTAQNLKGFLGL
jgi:glycerate dehydrogenase